MKILFIAPNYLPHIGGVEKHLENLCYEMLKDGHYITILVQKFSSDYDDYERNENFEIIRINKNSKRFGNRINIFKYMLLNIKTILKYDILHFHDYNTFLSYGLGIYPVLKLFDKKLYITFHGWEGSVPPKKKVIIQRKIIEKLTYKNICIGDFIPKWYGTKADIISYGGVNYVQDLSSNKEKYILFVGRLAADTGIYDYLKAWEIISKKNNLKFLICGDGLLKEELEDYVKNHNIQRIIFQGFVADVEKYIKDAKIIFTAGYLGILEAFAYKKNVIATYDNELKKDYLTMLPNYQAMMWVVDNNKDNIIKAIDEAMNDDIKKEFAYKYALENSWQKVKEDYYRLWEI